MKKERLQRINIVLIIFLVAAFLLIVYAILLFLLPDVFSTSTRNLSTIYFVVSCTLFAVVMIITYLSSQREKLVEERKSSTESFTNEHFIYTETRLKEVMAPRMRKKRTNGLVAAVSIRDIHSDILNLYGANVVREIDETVLNCISNRFSSDPRCSYAFNMLDGFFIYKESDRIESFQDELKKLNDDVLAALKSSASMPSCKILIGVYKIQKGDKPADALKKAVFAEKFTANGRLNDDVILFDETMVTHVEEQRELAAELEKALANEEFELFFQPKYSLKRKGYYGSESLIRWHHPTRGLLPPSQFIPFAESSGNITDVDYYVFRHVCKSFQEWKKNGTPCLITSVNLSRKTVYVPGLLDFFKKTIREYDVDPSYIEIELTESIAAKDSIYIADIIRKLQEIGFRTAIDDFGVGYSSFSSLKRIPFNTLKIDKSFIDDVEINPRSRSLVKMVIDLGHALNMESVAEGVESKKQVSLLSSMKLDNIQGYYYSKPLSGFDYVRFLSNNKVVLKEEKKQ